MKKGIKVGTRATKADEVVVKVVLEDPATNDVGDEDLTLDMDVGDLVEVRSDEDKDNERIIAQIRALPWEQARDMPASQLYAMADFVAHMLG